MNPRVSQYGKNVAARKGGKICNHTRKAQENINGDKRDMTRAHKLIPFCFNRGTLRAHLLARLTYLMEIYRWTAVWLTVHTGMVVIAPPIERVQKVSRTVGFGSKLWKKTHKVSNQKLFNIKKLKSSHYSLKYCHPLSVFIHFNHVPKAPCSVDTHNAQGDESRQHKNEVKCVSPHDSLKTSLSLKINNRKSTRGNKQNRYHLQMRKDRKNVRISLNMKGIRIYSHRSLTKRVYELCISFQPSSLKNPFGC